MNNRIPAADTGLPKTAPLAALGLLTDTATGETPVMALFLAWDAQRKACAAAKGETDDDTFAALVLRQVEIEAELIRTPATCAQDFAAKVVAFTAEGWNTIPAPEDDRAFWAEVERFVMGRS